MSLKFINRPTYFLYKLFKIIKKFWKAYRASHFFELRETSIKSINQNLSDLYTNSSHIYMVFLESINYRTAI